jgi:hypothetical protein
MRCEQERSHVYQFSQSEVDAFERLLSEFIGTVGAAKINDKVSDLELPVEITRFGGQPYAEAQDDWPECPKCGLSLNFVGQISEHISFDDDSVHNLLITIFYCFSDWPEVTAEGEGFIVAPYWDASSEKFAAIKPKKKLSRRATKGSRDSVWLEPMEYLPSPREIDLEDLGIPENYYTHRFEENNQALRKTADVIGGGPYPPGARILTCEECDGELETAYTLFIDGSFSIVACPRHPGNPLCFHQR